MILIFSSYVEYSTALVINWLNYKNASFLRLNYLVSGKGDEIIDFDIEIGKNQSILIKKHNKIIDIKKIESVWFRRLQNNAPIDLKYELIDKATEDKINVMKFTEKSSLLTYLVHSLKDVNWLNHPKDIYINKPDQLSKAKLYGLNTPDTLITTNKKSLLEFKKNYERIITKAIGNLQPLYLPIEHAQYSFYSSLISEEKLNETPDSFYPSLFQEYIDKKFEIRSFFIGEKFFHCAMFTQNDDVTKVDFRRFSQDSFTRRIVYNMPKETEDKLRKLVKHYQLSSGSIDSIYTKAGEIYFLEINPVGQFGFISYFCNFYLEVEFADFLISNKYE